ncbi:MAG: metallophosphoesterase [Actinobacteria bacterium]|nr:metallophosphoesterase [Actinomycetota bacterium]
MSVATMQRVAVYVVSDLHGAPGALSKAVPEASSLILLGDLINFIDYTSMTGILAEVFATEAVEEVVRLRTLGRVKEAGQVLRQSSMGHEEHIRSEIGTRVQKQYEEVFAALPDPTYLILGNVDNPSYVNELAAETPSVRVVDGEVVTLEGERFGFVGGALPSPLNVAGEISEDSMRAKVDALGEADIICSHVPPDVPELCYDTRARRLERGSVDLARYIEEVQPRRAYFGHVHQPFLSSMHMGRTLCINVGYFRATGRAFPHRRDDDSWSM